MGGKRIPVIDRLQRGLKAMPNGCWEWCATPSHEICQDAEGMEFKTCMYDYYLECIRQPDEWYGNSGAGII